jgi:hypothetical protein
MLNHLALLRKRIGQGGPASIAAATIANIEPHFVMSAVAATVD